MWQHNITFSYSYCWIEPTKHASADHAAVTLTRWNRMFSAPPAWVSDQGSHFMNSTLATLADEYGIRHAPSSAYAPWPNGTMKRLNRDILNAARAMLAESKLAPQNLPLVSSPLQAMISESPTVKLGKNADGTTRTPFQVMTGIKPTP